MSTATATIELKEGVAQLPLWAKKARDLTKEVWDNPKLERVHTSSTDGFMRDTYLTTDDPTKQDVYVLTYVYDPNDEIIVFEFTQTLLTAKLTNPKKINNGRQHSKLRPYSET